MFIFVRYEFCTSAGQFKKSFDSTGTILTVKVFHPVKTPTNHFITSVILDINGKEMVKQSYSSQLNKNEQVAIYKIIDVKKDDKINITTQCNIAGKKKATLVYTFTK